MHSSQMETSADNVHDSVYDAATELYSHGNYASSLECSLFYTQSECSVVMYWSSNWLVIGCQTLITYILHYNVCAFVISPIQITSSCFYVTEQWFLNFRPP
ncbi:hypothetical protein TNCV_288511 [Trichonephila clavipes]|nr:hypothetical protein TNCV_288511 [Trichonephila clavipes]